ncbi:uncharacterized protein DUF222 [Antricoccus suffuscus]|uniref:Uncharacterized protein DUF222 n=1 Tax=Antricoccus suffuscus TaxID=1629062 RepID=A0A2T0ZRV7_9ACTN|nr:DUF222 domain-containing protein [Antricoccus suffuscus]PRZ39055.1 uncharacterized protein DUF222 [Antricoccus suffuscus]
MSPREQLATARRDLDDALSAYLKTATPAVLSGLGPQGALDSTRDFETVRNRIALADHAHVAALDATHAATLFARPTTATLLALTLRITPAEARARVRAAENLAPRIAFTGQAMAPLRPVLAKKQADGTVTPPQAGRILHHLEAFEKNPRIGTAQIEQAEQILTDLTNTLGPADLDTAAARILDVLDPDGDPPSDAEQQRRRALTLTRDGKITGRLTPAACAKLQALIDPLAAPRPTGESGPDPRTGTQRRHDALEAICNRLLDTGQVHGKAGTRATVIVTMNADHLMTQCGYATSTHGQRIPVRDLLREAADLKIIPAVLNTNGVPLFLGRARRLASASQFHALIARDGGCSFPGCDLPPEWCDIHERREALIDRVEVRDHHHCPVVAG